MAVTDWIQTAAVIYFAWQQNRIFKDQNEIFANQARQGNVPGKTSRWLQFKRYWPTMAMVALMLLTGYDIYDRHANGASGANFIGATWWRYLPLLMLIGVGIGLMIARLTRAKANTPEQKKLTIRSAFYGTGPLDEREVTERLSMTATDALVVPVDNNFLGCDPAPMKKKRLRVEYSYGNLSILQATRWEGGRLVLPEDSEIARLAHEIEQVTQDLEKAKASNAELSRSPAIKLDAAQIGKAGGLMTRAGEAEALAVELERIWHLYLQNKETLRRPLGAKALPAWAEHHQTQLFRFRTIYQWHIDSIKELDASFHSIVMDHGFPNEDEYVDVKRNLEEHAKLLRKLASTLGAPDTRVNLYAEKHRLEDELEALELPEPPPSLKDVPADSIASIAMMHSPIRPMTNQELYDSRKKDRKIKRL